MVSFDITCWACWSSGLCCLHKSHIHFSWDSLFLGRNVAFICCLHKSHIHLSWGEIWINFDACHVFGEIAINVSTLLFSVFIVFHHDTQTYDFILWITWRIYDIIFSSDVSFLFFLLFEIPLIRFFILLLKTGQLNLMCPDWSHSAFWD